MAQVKDLIELTLGDLWQEVKGEGDWWGDLRGQTVRLVDEAEEDEYLISIIRLGYISVAGLLAKLGSFKSYRNSRQLIQNGRRTRKTNTAGGTVMGASPMSF